MALEWQEIRPNLLPLFSNYLLFPIRLYRTVTVSRFLRLFFGSYTVGRTPWASDRPVPRPLPKYRTTQTQNKCTHTPNIDTLSGIRTHDHGVRASEDSSCLRSLSYRERLAPERAKTVHALDRSATATGQQLFWSQNTFLITSLSDTNLEELRKYICRQLWKRYVHWSKPTGIHNDPRCSERKHDCNRLWVVEDNSEVFSEIVRPLI
jgi:hypothetical protein